MSYFIAIPITLMLACALWYYRLSAQAGGNIAFRILSGLLGAALFVLIPEAFQKLFPTTWRIYLQSFPSDGYAIGTLFLTTAAFVCALGLLFHLALRK